MTIDIGFQRATQAQLRNVTEQADADAVGTVDRFDAEDFANEGDVGVFESIGQAATDTGLVTGGIKLLLDDSPPIHVDPNFDLGQTLERRNDLRTLIQPHLNNPDSELSKSLFTELADTRSEEELEFALARVQAAEEDLRVAQANGLIPELGGMALGIGVDVAAVAAILALGPGGAAAGGGAATLNVGARSANIARLVAAGRIAGLGAAEGASERFVQGLTNPLVTRGDIFEAAGYGAGFGGLLGLVSPTFIGGVVRDAGGDTVERAAAASGREPESVGAAASPGHRETAVPAEGASPFSLGTGTLAQMFFRNPKRILTDIGVAGRKEFEAEGRVGARQFYNVMSRVFNVSTVHTSEVGGRVARDVTVQDLTNAFKANRISREIDVEREYREALKDVFGVEGFVGRALHNVTPGNAKKLSQQQYEAMADEVGIALGAGRSLDEINVIPPELEAQLTPDARAKLMDHLEKTGRNDNRFYENWGKMQVELGMIPEEDLISGYRPQRWSPDAIEDDPIGFELFLADVFADTPDEDWVRRTFAELDDEGKPTGKNAMRDDESWADFAKREPDLASEALAEWSAGIKRVAEDKAFEARAAKERELARFGEESVEAIETRMEEALAPLLERREFLREGAPAAAKTTGQKIVISEKLARTERRIKELEDKLSVVRALKKTEDGALEAARRFGNAATKRKGTKLSKSMKAAIRREAAATARATAFDEIRRIRELLVEGKNPVGLIPEDLLTTGSPRLKQRNINLGRWRHDSRARRFLKTNATDARTAFEVQVGTIAAIKRVFGNDANADTVREMAIEGFLEDATKFGGRKDVAKQRKRAESLATGMLKELTGSHIMTGKLGRQIETSANLASSVVSAVMLGGQALSQIADVALITMAGGKLGTGFRHFFTGRSAKKALRDLVEAGETETALIIQGLDVFDAGRFSKLADIDEDGLNVAGGLLGTAARYANNLAVFEGYVNLATFWNNAIRRVFGSDFVRQIDEDFANYAELPRSVKTFYAKIGIDESTAGEIARMMDQHHIRTANGLLRVPDSRVWSEKAPDLLLKWRLAIQRAGDEAMPSPGAGDRPFLRHYPGGRLVLQFTAFVFTAGERFLAPLIQSMRLHPEAARPFIAAFLGLTLGVLADGLKAGVRGESEAWLDRWDDPRGVRDLLWAGLLRSPMMVGNSATLTEVALNQIGRPINDRVESVTGLRPMMEAPTRFKEQQGAFALFGPAAGLAAGTIPSMTRKFVDGDLEGFRDMAARRLPVLNVFYLQLLNQIME